jgi:hypothetical protein
LLVGAAVRTADAIDRVQGREQDQHRGDDEPSHALIMPRFGTLLVLPLRGEVERAQLLKAFDIERQSRDTAGSALTGRHPPAAREHSHLFWSESCAYAPSFSLVSAGYRRLMKGGRNDGVEVSPHPSVSRIPP